MNQLIKHIEKLDWKIVLATISLSFFGLISIYSSLGFDVIVQKQISFLFIGLIAMFVVSFSDWRMFKHGSKTIIYLYGIGIALLMGLFFFAPAMREVRRWYSIGPLSFDPVEYMKIVLIILLAKYFSERHIEMYRFSHVIFSGVYVGIPALITFFQPDLGSAIILISLWLGILILSGIKRKHLVVLILTGILIFSLSWMFFFKDYQKARIAGFLQPKLDPQGINWNPEQARIAIGSGGLFGQGLGKGPQTQYGFLPEARTDFIFSAIAEETGLVGVSVVLFLFLFLIYRVIKIGMKSEDNFSRIFCCGTAVVLLSQIFVNIGMNQGLLPIVGIPLPFVSYGGSNLVFSFILLGIVQSIHISNKP